jgi:hypothetical protein
MKGRRSAALLCVLLVHALLLWMFRLQRIDDRPPAAAGEFASEPITLYLQPLPEPPAEQQQSVPAPTTPRAPQSAPPPVAGAPAESGAISTPPATPSARVDWPLEGKKAAERVLAREAEAERIARMFAGPGGTWASLTKRQRSKLNKFRFKRGIDGLEYDEKGNQIYHISDGCVIVNSGFIACAIGKAKVRGDMFENMREYFDELRLPETSDGNGTEPEALRPPY